MNIKVLLENMIEAGASDLHIKPGIPPVVRVNGRLQRTSFPAPTPTEMEELAKKVLTPLQLEKFESTREVDFAFGVTGLARFRRTWIAAERERLCSSFRRALAKTIEGSSLACSFEAFPLAWIEPCPGHPSKLGKDGPFRHRMPPGREPEKWSGRSSPALPDTSSEVWRRGQC